MSSTPLTYKNKGITVIGPANIKNKLNPGFDKLKSLNPFLTIKKKAIKANGKINKLSTSKPISVSTLIFFLIRL